MEAICDDRTDDHHVNKNSAGKNNSVGGRNMESIIRDINLAESGERKIEWVKRN